LRSTVDGRAVLIRLSIKFRGDNYSNESHIFLPKTNAPTLLAPASLMQRAAAFRVEPVVITSSNNNIFRFRTSGKAENALSKLISLSSKGSSVWGRVARVRLNQCR